MKYIYIAGPIGDYHHARENIHAAVEAAEELIAFNYFPFVPHLWYYAERLHGLGHEYETMLEYDLRWVEQCDGVLRLPGHSPGADREVAHARKKDIPVFYGTVYDFIAHRKEAIRG